jgi:hypothetical protein
MKQTTLAEQVKQSQKEFKKFPKWLQQSLMNDLATMRETVKIERTK